MVGDFQSSGGDLNGYYLQDPAGDGDPATSDGIFIYAPGGTDVDRGRSGAGARHGERVLRPDRDHRRRRSGSARRGNAARRRTALTLPVASLDDFEPYEGMLVTFPQTLYISEYFDFDRYGEIVLTSAPPVPADGGVRAGLAGGGGAGRSQRSWTASRWTTAAPRRTPTRPVTRTAPIFDLTNRFRGGDTVTERDRGAGLHASACTASSRRRAPTYAAANPRPAAPADGRRHAEGGVLQRAQLLHHPRAAGGPNDADRVRPGSGPRSSPRWRRSTPTWSASSRSRTTPTAIADLVAGLNAADGRRHVRLHRHRGHRHRRRSRWRSSTSRRR